MNVASTERGKPGVILTMNTLAFTACFAAWMMNGVLVTFLVDNRVFAFDAVQVGWLLGIPVLTGALLRLPVGMLTDRFGGRRVFAGVMILAALGLLGLSRANSFLGFALGSLGFGLAGTSFAVGVAYTSLWFKRERQGTALGVFGAGNAGSALTSVFAPLVLKTLTVGGTQPDRWRLLPVGYAALLGVMTVAFWLLTEEKKPATATSKSLSQQLSVLRSVRVWRFGLYYFVVFGCFVALAQWLIPYYVNVFGMSLASAGLLAAVFSFPSGVVRALGGWMSDRYGARTTMYGVLGVCVLGCLALSVPPLDLNTPGEGVPSTGRGVVTAVSESAVVVSGKVYALRRDGLAGPTADATGWRPRISVNQQPVVKVGDKVERKQLLARGLTRLSFTPNIWLFTALVFIVGIAMGIGKAAVYKHIPDYFPDQVGVVGGLVGVIGGLGGFVCPILFGYLLRETGLWTSSWLFLCALSAVSLVWMHRVVRKIEISRTREIEAALEEVRGEGRLAVRTPVPASVSTFSSQ